MRPTPRLITPVMQTARQSVPCSRQMAQGSGLDADQVDGLHASAFALASHLHDTRYYTEGEVNALLAAQEARIAVLEALLNGVTRNGDTLVFGSPGSGMNVQIVDGSGDTDGVVNGLGNLIVGYNENSGQTRTGSHNLIVGPDHSYSSYAGLVVGYENTITGSYSSVSGGSGNTASGSYASVSGGYGNVASGSYSSVSGGHDNEASGEGSSITGGGHNGASGSNATVVGGGSDDPYDGNHAWGHYSAILGGIENITGDPSWGTHATGEGATISGGDDNMAQGDNATVSGGHQNEAPGYASAVGGGDGLTAYSAYSFLP